MRNSLDYKYLDLQCELLFINSFPGVAAIVILSSANV